MQYLYVLLATAVMAALLLAAGIVDHFRRKKRTAEVKAFALRNAFNFREYLTQDLLPEFEIFGKGYGRAARNALAIEKNGVEWTVFDYKYTVGVGSKTHTYKQTFFWAETPRKLPRFILTREHLIHKIIALAGFDDINFESNPKFSEMYYLKSPDAKIRDVFKSPVLKFFEDDGTQYNIESNGTDIIFYRLGREISTGDIIQEFEHIAIMLELFRKK
jgi:hypothetical protein